MQDASFETYIKPLLVATTLICLLPSVCLYFGIDFSSQTSNLTQGEFTEGGIEHSFRQLRGALSHALLEWSTVTLSILVMTSALVHFAFHRDITIPIIGTSLLCAGFTDAFHTLAAIRMIEASADNSNFIPFTWALSRMFYGVIILLGSILSIWMLSLNTNVKKSSIGQPAFLLLVIVSFFLMAYLAVHFSAVSDTLPQTTFSKRFNQSSIRCYTASVIFC